MQVEHNSKKKRMRFQLELLRRSLIYGKIYNQEHSLCNPYLYKNEVPPWLAVQMGSVTVYVTTKVTSFSFTVLISSRLFYRNNDFPAKSSNNA